MERVVHKAKTFRDADQWDRTQRMAMTIRERTAIAAELKRRVYGETQPDVRACHRTR